MGNSSSSSSAAGPKIHVFFASETGRAKETAEDVQRELFCKGYNCQPARDVASISLSSLLEIKKRNEVVVFLVSTAGQGDPPTGFKPLWSELLAANLAADCFSSAGSSKSSTGKALQFSVFGLGDSGYAEFNYAARRLKVRLEQLGAESFHRIGISEFHFHKEKSNFPRDPIYFPRGLCYKTWYNRVKTTARKMERDCLFQIFQKPIFHSNLISDS